MLAQMAAQVVVVDYDCPDGTAAWVRDNHPEVKVVRVENTSGFRIAHGRNLGAATATTDWLAFLDADMLLAPGFLASLLPGLKPNHYFRPKPLTRQNWGSFVCSRQNFTKVGGYDEVYEGWGGEDDDIYEALTLSGARPANFDGALITEIEHDDEMRVKFHKVSKITSHRINQHYRRIKFDLTKLVRSQLPEVSRREIYAKVTTAICELENGEDEERLVTLRLPDLQFAPPSSDDPNLKGQVARMSRIIQYELKLQP